MLIKLLKLTLSQDKRTDHFLPDEYIYSGHMTPLNISVGLTREKIYELGRREPYTRFAKFPVEINESIKPDYPEND